MLICGVLGVSGAPRVTVQPVLPAVQAGRRVHPVGQRQGQGCLPQGPASDWESVMWGRGEGPGDFGIPPATGACWHLRCGVVPSAPFCLPVQLLQVAKFGCRGAASLLSDYMEEA